MSDCRGMSGLPVSVNLLLMLASLIAEIMAEEAYLLVGTGRGIERLELDGSGNTTILATPPGVGVIAMDYHHQHNMLFYSTDNLQIRRCTLTGENDQLLETNVESLGMVVDDANNKLYWGKAGPGEIWVSDVQDWWVTQNPISRLQLPYGITLDVKNGRIYFMENDAGAVKSTKLDGTNLVTLVEDESYGPTATMLSGSQLYWSDSVSHTVHVTDTQTRADSVLLSDLDVYGIAVYGEHLYLADLGGFVRRCGLDGNGLTTIAENLEVPHGVLVVSAGVRAVGRGVTMLLLLMLVGLLVTQ